MARKNTRNSYARRNPTSPSSFAGIWLLIGILLGVGIMGMAYIFYNPSHSQYFKSTSGALTLEAQEAQARHRQNKISHRRSEETPKGQEPRFEFYTMLPGMEVTARPQAGDSDKAKPVSTKSEKLEHLKNERLEHSKSEKLEYPKSERIEHSKSEKLEYSKSDTLEHPKTAKSNSETKSKSGSHYIVQAGIFQALTEADALKARLTLHGFAAQIQKVQTQDGHAWFRVTLGPFTSETLALNQKKRLETQKMRGILILQRPTE